MDVVDRMVDGYEIKHAIYIGNKEILLGMDEAKPDAPYMVCDCIWDNPLGIDRYDNAVGSADYFEIMTEFLARAQAQLEAVKAERVETPIPPLYKGALHAERLQPEHRRQGCGDPPGVPFARIPNRREAACAGDGASAHMETPEAGRYTRSTSIRARMPAETARTYSAF